MYSLFKTTINPIAFDEYQKEKKFQLCSFHVLLFFVKIFVKRKKNAPYMNKLSSSRDIYIFSLL
jgi:hypothetical protein